MDPLYSAVQCEAVNKRVDAEPIVMAMTDNEKRIFLSLYNRDGCVLDFSTVNFDAFTMRSVGVALCSRYQLSKGKSLSAYIEEAPEADATKLLCDLFDYYKVHFYKEIEGTSSAHGVDEYRHYYKMCVPIVERKREDISTSVQKKNLEATFTSEYMHQQIDMLFKSRETNPTEAIGKSKELIESCCKTILEERDESYNKEWTLTQLVKATMKCLGIETDAINADLPAGGTVKKILSSLGNTAGGIAELRNPYGTGHGKSDSYKGLTVRHAKLAVGSAATLVEYLWDAHEWKSGATEKR